MIASFLNFVAYVLTKMGQLTIDIDGFSISLLGLVMIPTIIGLAITGVMMIFKE